MRTFTVSRRLIKQIGADKRSLGLMFGAPILIIYLLQVVLTSSVSQPVIDMINAPEDFEKHLEKYADIHNIASEEEAIQRLESGESDAYLLIKGNMPVLTLEGSDPTVNSNVHRALQQTMQEISREALAALPNPIPLPEKPEVKYYFGDKDLSSFDFLAPVLMGFFVFFFVFILSGISFLRERISGTLDRTLATPLRRGEIVVGYFVGFGMFVVIQTILIQLFTVFGLDVPLAGSFWLVLLVNILLAMVALSLGTFLSAYARNELQLFQFIPIVIVPQVLFSGIFDLSEAPEWVNVLSTIFPLTYGAEALRDVMIRGKGFSDIALEVTILLGYSLFFLVLNTLALKKYRKV
jgi:ABC-2 type transport system permease protein